MGFGAIAVQYAAVVALHYAATPALAAVVFWLWIPLMIGFVAWCFVARDLALVGHWAAAFVAHCGLAVFLLRHAA